MEWADVLAVAGEYPGVVEAASYGTPALKVRGKVLTRLRVEDDSLVLMDVPEDEKRMLIAADPGLFHTTPHYDGYSAVLARLALLERAQLRWFVERTYRRLAGARLRAEWAAARLPGGDEASIE